MLKDRIDNLIADAMKEKNQVRLETLRNIKSELLKFQKSEKGSSYNEMIENDIILKLISRSEDSIKQFKSGNRDDLAKREEEQLEIIKEFAPKIYSDDEIKEVTKEIIQTYLSEKGEEYKISMKDTKPILELVKIKCSNANGKHISDVIKSMI